MAESRGRPKEQEAIPWQKYTQEFIEVPSKPELGGRSVWYYDRSKNDRGPWKTEHYEMKGYKHPKQQIDQRMYAKDMPTVIVFSTSNRSNAKIKMKIINKNIDYILSAKKIPGIPKIAKWLEVGVGKSFIDEFKQKYNLN
tara:strand:- start:135 stop:554 length:420 start_codon:yes stop_codon:yes gene_type:complete